MTLPAVITASGAAAKSPSGPTGLVAGVAQPIATALAGPIQPTPAPVVSDVLPVVSGASTSAPVVSGVIAPQLTALTTPLVQGLSDSAADVAAPAVSTVTAPVVQTVAGTTAPVLQTVVDAASPVVPTAVWRRRDAWSRTQRLLSCRPFLAWQPRLCRPRRLRLPPSLRAWYRAWPRRRCGRWPVWLSRWCTAWRVSPGRRCGRLRPRRRRWCTAWRLWPSRRCGLWPV